MMQLSELKTLLGILIQDDDYDAMLSLKLLAVTEYLTNAGATETSLESQIGNSCVALGVNDLLNNKAGEVKFSPAFILLAQQVCRG